MQRRVVGHAFTQPLVAVAPPADQIAPPLVRDLVSRDVENVIDGLFVVLVELGDEALVLEDLNMGLENGGQVQATAPNPRVKVMGQPIVMQAAPAKPFIASFIAAAVF